MILTTHALVGATIGKNVGNLWLVIALSLIVHFVMDSFRHGEYFDSRTATIKNTAWKVIFDLAIGGGIILFYLSYVHPSFPAVQNILLGSFFSMLPDLVTVFFWKFHWQFLEKIIAFHSLSHRYSKFPRFSPERQWTLQNAMNDILISLLAVIFIFCL
jgi:hypothetical protein